MIGTRIRLKVSFVQTYRKLDAKIHLERYIKVKQKPSCEKCGSEVKGKYMGHLLQIDFINIGFDTGLLWAS